MTNDGKFEVGDEVECVSENGCNHPIKQRYGVFEVTKIGFIRVTPECPIGGHDQCRFKLVRSAPPMQPSTPLDTYTVKRGSCDNCGTTGTVFRRTLKGGAVVWDCNKCTAGVQRVPPKLVDMEVPRMTPDVRCRCCHVRAPRKVVADHAIPGNILEVGKLVNQPDLTGWMLVVYPYADPMLRSAATAKGTDMLRFGVRWEEVNKLCPACAVKVTGTMVHITEGYNDGE